jgi:hypothetical protein
MSHSPLTLFFNPELEISPLWGPPTSTAKYKFRANQEIRANP